MAQVGARRDPFPAFRFEIQLDNLSVGGFSHCAGLQLKTKVFNYREGGLNTHTRKFFTRIEQADITLTRGIVDRQLWDWYWELMQGRLALRNGTILIYDAAGQTVEQAWHFFQAFPGQWIGPELDARQNNVAVETLVLCHQGLRQHP